MFSLLLYRQYSAIHNVQRKFLPISHVYSYTFYPALFLMYSPSHLYSTIPHVHSYTFCTALFPVHAVSPYIFCTALFPVHTVSPYIFCTALFLASSPSLMFNVHQSIIKRVRIQNTLGAKCIQQFRKYIYIIQVVVKINL